MAEFKPCVMLETDQQIQIISLDALTYAGSMDNLKSLPDESRDTFVQGDICNRTLVDRLLREHEMDTVVHFSAESDVDNSISTPEIFVQTICHGHVHPIGCSKEISAERKRLG